MKGEICVKHDALYEKLSFLKEIDEERRKQFEEYFENAPLWLIEAFQTERIKKETILAREGEAADSIFFIGNGIVEAIEYRVLGTPYCYMQFNEVRALGGMEVIMGLDGYMTTLQTVTDCIVVKLSRTVFEKWMYSNIHIMKREAKRMGRNLWEEGRHNRLFLFLQGADRLAFLFVDRYERYSKNGLLHVIGSRQNLADETGLCVKSISRGVKKFMSEGLISKKGNQIYINKEQYEGLKKIVSLKIDLD